MAGRIKLGGSPLDTSMAAFASGAVAFFTFTMPAEILARIVVIGSQTGRYLFSGATALITFLGVSLLLRALSKAPAPADAETLSADPVRLRRADMHPDAPSCTPLLAGLELGVPLNEMPVEQEQADEIELTDAHRVHDDVAPPLPEFLEQTPAGVAEEAIESVATEQVEKPPLDIPFWIPREVPSVAEADEPETNELLSAHEPEALEAPYPPSINDEDPVSHHDLDELGQRLPKKQALELDSIDEMVERFEAHTGARSRAADASDPAVVSEEDDALQERLRGAIRDLRKVARG